MHTWAQRAQGEPEKNENSVSHRITSYLTPKAKNWIFLYRFILPVPPRIHHISSGGHMQVKKGASVRIECSASGMFCTFEYLHIIISLDTLLTIIYLSPPQVIRARI